MNITSGIPNNFTMTNDTNWLNRKPSGIASISDKKPNNIFSMTSRRATSFFFIPRSIYVPNSLLRFSNMNLVVQLIKKHTTNTIMIFTKVRTFLNESIPDDSFTTSSELAIRLNASMSENEIVMVIR